MNTISAGNIDRIYTSIKSYVDEVCRQYGRTRAVREGNIIGKVSSK